MCFLCCNKPRNLLQLENVVLNSAFTFEKIAKKKEDKFMKVHFNNTVEKNFLHCKMLLTFHFMVISIIFFYCIGCSVNSRNRKFINIIKVT